MYKRSVLLVAFFFLSVVSLAYAGSDDGKAAYEEGNYAKAYEQFQGWRDWGTLKLNILWDLCMTKGKAWRRIAPRR